MSKGARELVAQSWFKSFFSPNSKLGAVVTVRAGNVIGGEIMQRIGSCRTVFAHFAKESRLQSAIQQP